MKENPYIPDTFLFSPRDQQETIHTQTQPEPVPETKETPQPSPTKTKDTPAVQSPARKSISPMKEQREPEPVEPTFNKEALPVPPETAPRRSQRTRRKPDRLNL